MSTAPKPSILPVSFRIRQVVNEARSRVEGHKVLEPEEWIKIRVGGDVLDHKVSAQDIEDYPLEYEAWTQGQRYPGTPMSVLIEEAPDLMTEDAADSLKALHGITTLEQLAGKPDGTLNFGHGRALQRKAKEILESRAEAKAEETVARRDLKAESLEAQVAALSAEVARLRELTQPGGLK